MLQRFQAFAIICTIAALSIQAVSTRSSSSTFRIPARANTYRSRVTREARAAGGLNAPVSIFAAQIQQESGWNSEARSGVGAEGIAQFMPGTAAWIAKVYPAQLGTAAPLDPAWAIRALVRYDYNLFGQLESFRDGAPPSDRWAAALSAYNGGLGWVYRDAKASRCDASLWWDCVSFTPDARTPSNYSQNRTYPLRILGIYAPAYAAAGW